MENLDEADSEVRTETFDTECAAAQKSWALSATRPAGRAPF